MKPRVHNERRNSGDARRPMPIRKPTPNEAARLVLKEFGVLVIPVDPATIVGKLEGQRTNLYGNFPTGLLFEYVRPASQDEWQEHAAFIHNMLGKRPKAPSSWPIWVLKEVWVPLTGTLPIQNRSEEDEN